MSTSMQAVVNFAPEAESVDFREVAVPEIGEDDVLLAVQAVSICGSDLHQYFGTQSWRVNYPVVLGHEFGGVVVRTGRRVRAFEEGDRVVSETAAVIDPASPYARTGQYNLDPGRLGFGYGVNGAMTEYVRVPERCLHRVPDGLPFEQAALTEPCCVAYNAVCVNARIRPGDSVVVIGPGPIGLLCALMAKLSGANPLVVLGARGDEARLVAARALGADHTLGEAADDPAAFVRNLTDGYGADVVVDAAGVSATLQVAMDLVRPGGQITKVGWGPQACNYSLDPLVAKNVTLQGSFSHTWAMWEKVLRMLASGQIDLSPVLSRVAPLHAWRDCFEAMHQKEVVKAVLKPTA